MTYVAPFVPEFIGEPFPDAAGGPLAFHGDLFADGLHRLLFNAGTSRSLYKTADFATWTLIDADWLSGAGQGGANSFQDAAVLPDETILLYQNAASETSTRVWECTAAELDASTPTLLSPIVLNGTGGDCGVFYDAANDLIHIYTEDPDTPYGSASSERIKHFTTPASDPTTATFVGYIIDTEGAWGTGDVDVFEFDGRYWMTADYTVSHPSYWCALYVSDDLYAWTEVRAPWTDWAGTRGGDFDTLVVSPDLVVSFTEYSGPDLTGVGMWRFSPFVLRYATANHQLTAGNGKLIRLAVGPSLFA